MGKKAQMWDSAMSGFLKHHFRHFNLTPSSLFPSVNCNLFCFLLIMAAVCVLFKMLVHIHSSRIDPRSGKWTSHLTEEIVSCSTNSHVVLTTWWCFYFICTASDVFLYFYIILMLPMWTFSKRVPSSACFPLPLHLPLAKNQTGVSSGQPGVGVSEVSRRTLYFNKYYDYCTIFCIFAWVAEMCYCSATFFLTWTAVLIALAVFYSTSTDMDTSCAIFHPACFRLFWPVSLTMSPPPPVYNPISVLHLCNESG